MFNKWDRLPACHLHFDRLKAFLYPTSHHVLLPYQLVWQEAEFGKLETTRNSPDLLVLTFARSLQWRAKVKAGGLGALPGLAYEPYSPTRRARGGQKSESAFGGEGLGVRGRQFVKNICT